MTTSNAVTERSFLIVRTRSCLCALPIAMVREIMRYQPLEPLSGAPDFVLGVSIIRGEAIPVVALWALLGVSETDVPTRLVTIQSGRHRVALAVEAVVGVRALGPELCTALPPLVSKARPETLAAIGALDLQLLLVLQSGAIVPPEVWNAMGGSEAAR